ncbi:ACP phosphodiesterase [Fusobacterium polymorphum]|uniref:ACP phosphodiesterase n=1 Tax=Fusobacterium nucleatum subsp. polymorphum TaxID=76857 RepID=UPI00300ADB17
MNFLGHSLISLEIDKNINKETLYGNFTGDFYKGLVEKIELSENLKEGIILHRIIDKTSDRKENLLNELLTEKFGIFKGIVSDMFIDHFLSKNFYNLFNKNINNIERKILDKVEENKNIFPKDFEKTFDWLNHRNVMVNYKELDFLERAFQGLAKNVRRGEILNFAVSELKKNYNLFEEKSIKEFFYVKKESIKKFLKKIF